jgi:hypothetical protein
VERFHSSPSRPYRDPGFLRPDEIAEAKIGLRELLSGAPMRIERLDDGRAALHVR